MSAIAKLKRELENAKDKSFSEPIIEYLIKRCEEDPSMAEDVCQEHKTWDKCFSYIYGQARKHASGKSQCAVRNDVVFEWAEDYFHMDDKALEEQKAKQEQIKQVKKAESNKPNEDGATKEVKEQPQRDKVHDKKEKQTKSKGVVEGQMSMFDFM